jgi:spore germination cell wall hydrolase CwlJ-like protein
MEFASVLIASPAVRAAPAASRSPLLRAFAHRLGLAILLGTGATLFSTHDVARQDAGTLLAGESVSAWSQYLERSPAGSTHAAELAFDVDPAATGSITPFGAKVAGLGAVAITPKTGIAETTPDEMRVNRRDKAGRLVRIMPAAPPKGFSAGSILERHSSLIAPPADIKRAGFAKPAFKDKGGAVAVATAFHQRSKPKRVSGGKLADMPAAVADLVNNTDADILATAYAPVEPDFSKHSPFEAILTSTPQSAGRFVPSIGPKDHAWAKSILSPEVFSEKEQRCLAEGIYFEARGEVEKGQAAVAQVILNRVRNPKFPNTICGVVYQNVTWFNRCQFSFACDRVRDRVIPGKHWETAQAVALAVTAGKIWIEDVGSSTHYHATYVRPAWARTMVRVSKIGQHIFYRTRNGGWI